MKRVRTYGYDRRHKVPELPGTTPKVCRRCDAWFAARGKERKCDRCVPPAERLRRQQLARNAELAARSALRGSEGRTGRISRTLAATRKRRNSPANALVSGTVSDGGALCFELAIEKAEELDYPKGKPKPMSKAYARKVTRWNVSQGKQGACDLERYAA